MTHSPTANRFSDEESYRNILVLERYKALEPRGPGNLVVEMLSDWINYCCDEHKIDPIGERMHPLSTY
jgi:hypothetical protein